MKGNALLWVPVAFILGWITLNLAAGGSVFPNTGRPKSPFFTFGFSFSFLLQHSANFFLHVTKTLLSGLTSQSALTPLNKIDTLGFVPPFSLLLYLWAAPPRILRELRERRIGIHTLMVLWWGTGFIFVGVVSGGDHHHFRYLLPFLPAFIVYLPLGAADLARRMIPEASPSDATALRRTFWGLMLAFQAFTTVNFVLLYGQGACGFMEYRRLAQWTRANLEPGAAIAALDVGIIAYESGHRIVDLFGLVDNRMARSTFYYSDYIGSKFEAIRRLPPERRPAYVMLHRIRFDEQGDDAHLAPLRRHPVFTARSVTDRFPSIGRDLTLYEMDWMEGASPGDLRQEDARAAVAGKRLLHEWNAADLDGARSVHQRIRSIVPGIFPSNRIVRATAMDGQLVQEGALGINGSLEFSIDRESRGSLTLALRTAYAPDPLTVMVDGSTIGTWSCPVNEGGWTEAVFTIPASSLRRRANTITVSGRFMSAHWWIFQDPAGAR